MLAELLEAEDLEAILGHLSALKHLPEIIVYAAVGLDDLVIRRQTNRLKGRGDRSLFSELEIEQSVVCVEQKPFIHSVYLFLS